MRRAWALVVVLVGCGADEPPASQAVVAPRTEAEVAAVDGDPLLAEARRAIDHGVIAAGPRAAILASGAPVHARARALLAALEPDTAVAPPSDPPTPAPPTAVPDVPAVAVDRSAPPEPAVAKTPRARPTVERLSLRTTARGASLSIHAGSGVLVGVANQPETGVVRLVLDDVAAGAKVLGARPQVEGARVRAVEAGPRSVRITLQLEPGWRFSGVHRTSTGARVDLVGP
jgi:hypothetical protein